jgi:DNA topoisomerase-2
MTTKKTIEERFKLLTPVEHVLKRPGRYLGSVKPHTAECWVNVIENDLPISKMEKRTVTWNPGLLKMFDEIISNSVDHSKRPEGKHLDTIKVEIDRATGVISVYDNGGIPVQMHGEHGIYVPTLIFGHLLSGENFDDESDTVVTGQNGEGSSLVNIFSTSFTVETCDAKKKFKQTWTENMLKVSNPTIIDVDADRGFTKITFKPDYDRLETTLDDGNYAKIVKRVFDVAGCNPNLKITLNGQRIQIKSFKDYVAMYAETFEFDENEHWQIAVAHSDEGFQHVSFVNTTETVQGGTHLYYVWYQIAEKLRAYIKKKHKVDVKPTEIYQHMRIFINATIVRPRYDSQTKENLITEVKEYKTAWEATDKFINRIVKSDIIQSVLDWAAAKEKAIEAKQLRDLNKDANKFNVRKIIKLQDANLAGKDPEKCILFLTEGDSAAKAGKSTGDRNTMGFLALRGVPLNVANADVAKVVANTEFFNIMAAMGLKIGEEVKSPKQLRYGMLGIMTDADHDGAGHITGLLISNLHRFWPELFKLGIVHRFVTPAVKVWVPGQKKPISFYEEVDFKDWAAKNQHVKFKFKYYKGLATSQSEEFTEYLTNISDHLIQIRIEEEVDETVIDLVFGKGGDHADRRKEWLQLTE